MPAAFRLLPCWNGYSGSVVEKRLELLLHGHEEPNVIRIPAEIQPGLVWRFLIGIGPQVDDDGPAGHVPGGRGDVSIGHSEVDFPVVPADSIQLAALAEVVDLFAGPFFASPLKYGRKLYPSRWTFQVLPLAW